MFELNMSFAHYKDCSFRTEHLSVGERFSIVSKEEGPVCFVNVTDTGITTPEGYIIVKSYSENEGLYEELLRLGVIQPADYSIMVGYAECPVCKYSIERMKELS